MIHQLMETNDSQTNARKMPMFFHLHKDHDGNDGIADGKDAPQHAHRLRVPHELGRVVVGALPVVHPVVHLSCLVGRKAPQQANKQTNKQKNCHTHTPATAVSLHNWSREMLTPSRLTQN